MRHDQGGALNLGDWLVKLGVLTGGKMPAAEVREKVIAYHAMLTAKFPPSVFTVESLGHVATTANKAGTFATYGQVCAALEAWARANPVASGAPASAAIPAPAPRVERPRFPLEWVTGRLRAGADRAHILSLIRTYDPPEVVRAIMATHYPAELRAEDEHAAEVRRDKARAAERAKAAVVAALRSPDARRPGVPNTPRRPPPAETQAPEAQAAPPPPADAAEQPARPVRRYSAAEVREALRTLDMLEKATARGLQPAGGEARVAALRATVADMRESAAALRQ